MKRIFILFLCVVLCCAIPIFTQTQLVKELLEQGKITEARSELRNVISEFPKSEEAWLLLGETYLRMERPDSAVLVGQKLISINKKSINGYIFSAKARLATEDYTAATKILRSGLVIIKNNPVLYTELGYALLTADSVDKAIVAFYSAKEFDPENPSVYDGIGDAYIQQGITAMGITSYEKSLELDSNNTSVLYKIARAYAKERRYSEAAQTYLKVVQMDSTNLEAILELSQLFYSAKQYSNAARFLHSYLRHAPNPSPTVLEQYMEAAYLGKFYEDAITAATQYLEVNSQSSRAQQIIGNAYYELKQYDKSIESYQELSRKDTLARDDLIRLGKAYINTNHDSLAEVILNQVIDRDTTQAEVYRDLGAIYMRMKKWDQAVIMFERSLAIDSTSVSAFINFALCNMVLEKWDRARQALHHALQLKPDYMPAHMYLGNVFMQTDSLSRAREAYQKVIELADTAVVKYKNELADAHKNIGFTWLLEASYIKRLLTDEDIAERTRRLTRALEALNASLRLKNNDVQAHLTKAQTLALLNRRDEAIAEYKVVLKLDPKNKTAQDDLNMLAQ